jgi:hypothetical protein
MRFAEYTLFSGDLSHACNREYHIASFIPSSLGNVVDYDWVRNYEMAFTEICWIPFYYCTFYWGRKLE